MPEAWTFDDLDFALVRALHFGSARTSQTNCSQRLITRPPAWMA
jgi:hypothetical protein